jgi:hypothetical protein
LQVAEGKEQKAAEDLARAEIDKKRAAEASAKAEGVAATQAASTSGGQPAFELRINAAIFEQFESWECEEADKVQLRALKTELGSYKSAFESKDAQVRAFIEKVDTFEKEVRERMTKKKRKAEEPAAEVAAEGGEGKPPAATTEASAGGAVPGSASPGPAASSAAAASGAPAGAAAAGPTDEQVRQAAAAISKARFDAAKAVEQGKGGVGRGSGDNVKVPDGDENL